MGISRKEGVNSSTIGHGRRQSDDGGGSGGGDLSLMSVVGALAGVGHFGSR